MGKTPAPSHHGPAAERVRPEHHRRFARLMRDLDRLIGEIREYEPDAELYVESGGHMNLMVGPSHEGAGRPRHDHVAHMIVVQHTDGGGW